MSLWRTSLTTISVDPVAAALAADTAARPTHSKTASDFHSHNHSKTAFHSRHTELDLGFHFDISHLHRHADAEPLDSLAD